MSTQTEERTVASTGNDDVRGEKHIIRASGRRWDGTVETLCGQIRRASLTPRRNADRCQACIEMMRGIAALDQL